MYQKHYTIIILLIPLMFYGIGNSTVAQTLNLNKSVVNSSAHTNGTTAAKDDILEYTITVKNLSALNFTLSTLYDNIPAGTSYVAGSTTLNGVSVADVSGKMPFAGNGGLINSPSYSAGTLAPNVAASVVFSVKVTANGGSITNTGTVDATYNGTDVIQNTNSVLTNLTPDASCSIIYEMTPFADGGSIPYRYLRTINTSTGAGSAPVYDGSIGPCYDAISGASLAAGSLISSTMGTAAIAYDKYSNRIYFVNNIPDSPQNLGYIDLSATPVCARSFVGYPLETGTGNGYNINRMAFGSDGYGYAVTSGGTDFIQFSVDPVTNIPTINRLGALINDVNNDTNDILSEKGGDIFGDGSGKLYLIANSSKMYKINPANRVATFLGSVNPFPGTSQSVAVDAAGNMYIGGAYQDVYKIDPATMAAVSIGSGTGVYVSGDYTSCAFPVLSSAIRADKTFRDVNGNAMVVGGDIVEYSITVTNTGNINAAGVKLYDSVPSSTTYIAGSTKLNGVSVPDIGGTMPFYVTGGRLVNSPGEQGGIIKPGSANAAVVTFRVQTVPYQQVCNQSKITLLDIDGNTIFVNSGDPNQTGGQAPTCFFSDGVLALNELSFKGSLSNDQSVLQWSVKNDAHVAWYEIEYAENGVSFVSAGKIAGKGIDGVQSNYQFTDVAHTLSPLRYYRLKIVQKGGSHSYSGIIRLNVKGIDIQVLPNPFDRDLNVQLQLKNKETVQMRLIDFHGREVYHREEACSAGNQSISISLPASLAKGMYVMEVVAGSELIYQKKLLKR